MVLVGLGNPGPRYRWTPHNLGFHVVEAIASAHDAPWQLVAPSYARADCHVDSTDIILLQPQTFVNRSGRSLRDFAKHFELVVDEMLVVADDIALPFGRLRLRRRGSDGGHNGLKSVIDALGTTGFPRLRMGVGPVPPGEDPADYVLERLVGDARQAAEVLVERAVACVEDVVREGFDRAMNLHNTPEPESD